MGVAIVLALLPLPLHAEDSFFRVSPGPLTRAHAKLDDSASCSKCHELGGGVRNGLCLDCHAHADLKQAIEAHRGLHAGYGAKPCLRCHTEHKGRNAYINDWTAIGGQTHFDHKKTGFDLAGMHAKAACSACHKKRLESGRTSYTGLSQDCDTCHRNPHKFSNAALRKQCKQCHVPGVSIRNMRPKEIPFDHGKATGVPLLGKHGRVACVSCHRNGKMSMGAKPRSCVDCHKNPHGKTFVDSTCTDCHAPQRKWKDSSFDHDKTKFPLRGKHKTTPCSQCHKTKPSKENKPKTTCNTCHGDPHAGRFQKRTCETCHAVGGTTEMRFDHGKETRFPLTGKHTTLTCRSCHRGKGPKDYEKFPTTQCRDCHAHKKAHNGQFDDKQCTSCHKEGGSKNLVFDHQKDARFALTGFHLQLGEKGKCAKCHPKGTYRTGKIHCVDCHKDSHKGELGQACERCHRTDVKYKKTEFDHDRLSVFPLQAKHAKVPCAKCHPNRKYKLGKVQCVTCHAKDNPHTEKLGTACDRCHIPDKAAKAPKFQHDVMTAFKRDGAHLKVACSFCHRTRQNGEVAPPRHWTQGQVPPPLDKKFPVFGVRCKDCHADVHKGRNGDTCESCHNTRTFDVVSASMHDVGAFRLDGVHDTLPCAQCHTANKVLTGLGEICQTCHRDDDAHNGALGPFCGQCHGQVEWLPARFSHVDTGFNLRGAHRMAPCTGCHGLGNYIGTPVDCQACHLQDAQKVFDPVHTNDLADCTDCHSESGFLPARRYHPWFALSGRHNYARCRDCHGSGSYVGTPNVCSGCHLSAYLDPTNQPNHVAAGFSTDCESCHTPVGWKPALGSQP